MENKNLPIRIFYKRKQDDRLTEGGGSPNEPQWVLTSNELQFRASDLTEKINNIQKDPKKSKTIPTIIDVSIKEEAIAKSHRPMIESLFIGDGNESNLIELNSGNELLFSINNINHFDKIRRNLSNFEYNKKAISAIEEIVAFSPYVDDKARNSEILKVKLFNFNDKRLNDSLVNTLSEFCKERKIKFKEKSYTKSLSVFRLEKFSDEAFNELIQLDGIVSLEPMPFVTVDLQSLAHQSSVAIKIPVADKQYPTIGFLDSGIANIPHLNPWIKDVSSPYPESELNKDHGTFCAGITVYGNELQGLGGIGLDGCYLFDASVVPNLEKTRMTEDELIDNIKEVIQTFASKIKIWNMSVGTNEEAKSNSFSDFGKVLDELQDNHNIIIVKSAGNCRNFLSGLDPSRISRPADSVHALVVGSVAQSKNLGDISDINHRSPFSRVGPGPGFITKPELVHYGGNGHPDVTGKLIANGVFSFAPTGNLTTNIGTSFATPRVTACLAHLQHTIANSDDLLFLKTLLIHSARYPKEIQSELEQKVKELGFGLPGEIDDIIYNDPYEISLIYRDELPKGGFIEMMNFPFPDNLIDQGIYTGQIFITLCAKPLLAQRQGREYIQSDLSIKFGTYEKILKRDTTKKNIRNPIGKENPHNVLLKNLYSKKNTNKGMRETKLIEYEGKFHPIKKYIVDLREMTQANKEKILSSNNKWYLHIEGLYRHHIESKAAVSGEKLAIPFCLMITIKDPDKKINIYDRVSQQLTEQQFVHTPISINSNVDVRTETS
ncbi:S8 family peptidase [Leptospira santarosai]|uniref:Peptidase S8/S53 domain-containing protein n=1 Tax=Leptospira santarosai TaxID=28183 RepID=A0AB73MD92_9LEPT|nr:S8 family peptidase [Leptospira santarosai]ONF90597.1 hypothetical protein BWD14_19535 [Leptospira santarosai]